MTKQERGKQIKAKYSEPTSKDNHTHTAHNPHSEQINDIQMHAIRYTDTSKHKQDARKTEI